MRKLLALLLALCGVAYAGPFAITGSGGAGTIPLTSLATQATNTVVGNATSGTASPTALPVGTCSTAASALIWTTNTGFGCNTSITANTATTATGLATAPLANSVVTSDVAMNNTGNYFDGPTVAQGSTGTWFASGAVVVQDTAGAAAIQCKLWDGTTIIASGKVNTTALNLNATVALSGALATPAGNLRISCNDSSSTSGLIKFNASGSSKDSTITAFRIQ